MIGNNWCVNSLYIILTVNCSENLVEIGCNIAPNFQNCWIWKYNSNGIFPTDSTYYWLNNNYVNSHLTSFRWLWKHAIL